jgi:hypothetical protein
VEGRTEGIAEFDLAFTHVHLLIILHRQVGRYLNYVLLIERKFCLVFDLT